MAEEQGRAPTRFDRHPTASSSSTQQPACHARAHPRGDLRAVATGTTRRRKARTPGYPPLGAPLARCMQPAERTPHKG